MYWKAGNSGLSFLDDFGIIYFTAAGSLRIHAFQRISINADLGDNLLTHFVVAPACILHLCFY